MFPFLETTNLFATLHIHQKYKPIFHLGLQLF